MATGLFPVGHDEKKRCANTVAVDNLMILA